MSVKRVDPGDSGGDTYSLHVAFTLLCKRISKSFAVLSTSWLWVKEVVICLKKEVGSATSTRKAFEVVVDKAIIITIKVVVRVGEKDLYYSCGQAVL